MKMENYLGLDYGKSKIGLALANDEIRIAFAYKTIDNNKTFFEKLRSIVNEEKIDKIIVGELKTIGKHQKSFDDEKFGELIKKKFDIPVAYQEEMFSTKMAENNLKERGVKKIKKLDNQEAARIILQSWLDENRVK